jgi:hypothetical protein
MEAQYSPEAITAARSLQIYTVSLILVDPVAVDNLMIIVPPVHIRFVLSELPHPFLNSAQHRWLHSGWAKFTDVLSSAVKLACPDL